MAFSKIKAEFSPNLYIFFSASLQVQELCYRRSWKQQLAQAKVELREKRFRWNKKCTLWIQTVFYDFLLEISLFLMFKSTLKALTANSTRTITRAISFGTINYFSLFGEQNGSQLCWADLIQRLEKGEVQSLEGWNADPSLLQACRGGLISSGQHT